ncbi:MULTISPECIES: MarR family winged helix-turn-helix transcriptional regulator [Paenibacillus]|uniref:MarR family winged helix-turn-helix transcriptional regulator n=1 Tax=Paenibacillus TaxID=44249 RepID=UPI00094359F8|nr:MULTISPECIES: MarR family winged helix-turn-helix transcriptional regulator [Paenibacillus]NTZ19005.1 MarR family transcriptional regulator [Paenibacillus sp. JMULE4]
MLKQPFYSIVFFVSVLSQREKEDGQTQNRLACSTQKDEPSISRLIDNMIKRNLVKRLPHGTDRRTNLIYL